jgi:CubicO group peptidase (beta-lactamase class C family)
MNVGGYRVIRAAGYGGQRCWIIPSLDLVAVITSEPIQPDNNPEAILGQWIIPSIVVNKNEYNY